MSINKEVFKNKKNKVFAGAAKRNPKSHRKYGEVEDTESKEERKRKRRKKETRN